MSSKTNPRGQVAGDSAAAAEAAVQGDEDNKSLLSKVPSDTTDSKVRNPTRNSKDKVFQPPKTPKEARAFADNGVMERIHALSKLAKLERADVNLDKTAWTKLPGLNL